MSVYTKEQLKEKRDGLVRRRTEIEFGLVKLEKRTDLSKEQRAEKQKILKEKLADVERQSKKLEANAAQ